MNNPDHISKSLETIFSVKILKFFDADQGWKNLDRDWNNSDPEFEIREGKNRIRDGKNSDQGSGTNIPDPHHWSTISWFLRYASYPISLLSFISILILQF
jgi:hypothetical protein